MKKFRIHLNGKTYEVAVEEIHEADTDGRLVEKSTRAAPFAAVPGASKGDEVITAPMPGKILSIHVQTGQKVAEGELILSLEAMKMESDVFCGQAGVVKKILVQEGDAVNAGDLMVIVG